MGVLLLASGLAAARSDGSTDRPPEGAPGGKVSAQAVSVDLHVTAGSLRSETLGPGQSLLLCRDGVEMIVAGRRFAAERAMVWTAAGSPANKDATAPCRVQVYLAGKVSDQTLKEQRDSTLAVTVLERGKAIAVKADLVGEILVTADKKEETKNSQDQPLYREAVAAFKRAEWAQPSMREPPAPASPAKSARPEPNEPPVEYTISIGFVSSVVPKIQTSVTEDNQEIITYMGRSHLTWQEPNDRSDRVSVIELEADCLIVWRAAADPNAKGEATAADREVGVTAVYVSGDVLLTQGDRTIRADELYYDLRNRHALARNAVLKSYDPVRGIPIYIWAKQLRQIAVDTFEAEDVALTTSEFWTPQVSLEAAKIRIIDKRKDQEPDGILPDSGFDVELRDVKLKVGNTSVLDLPKVHSDRERPELPIRSVRMGHDDTYGTSVETRWWLSRLLGLKQPEGTDGYVAVDYYGDRGVGGGVDVSYERENYFGSLLGYIIEDHGEDRLSRTRKDIDVPEDTRGRFRFQHRQFLPYNWQVTTEVSYLSDKNFLEQFYRTEYNIGKEQETLLHLKRIQDNWGLSFLGKTRINDFMDQVEELPTGEYHMIGQSLFDDRLTFYSDSQASRYRYRYGEDSDATGPHDYFAYTGTRNELDMPLNAGAFRVVPFVAGTFAYEDGAGFTASLDDGSVAPEDAVAIGEGGVRMSMRPFWAVYPDVESRLWDLHQLRHTIQPTLTAVAYDASNEVADQRDTLDFGISQRWQTKRGPLGNRRTVDWLVWDLDFVWIDHSSDEVAGPDLFLWNEPFIPLVNRDGRVIPPLDRRTTDQYGPRQNYVGTEAILRLTDTTSILTDAYFDMQNGVVEQFDIGFSRLLWPNLTYYVGSRYLREVENGLGERGSNSLTFAATYVLDPRYTMVLAEQYDSDYGANVRTDVTLIRKYHRVNLALTFSVDESVDDQQFVLSLWPEGISELAIGLRRYMELGASDVYY
ncbi:MAG: hypothetical protein ACM3VT_03115 [Solirubrobacterales bacterium]